ncbi:hypothetical protein Ahy_B05g079511 [Arachis hypogaea]|uniref:Myb/SANT-like domain-containing protein n=1 Tax=Arachis hypogaea TaxID=3818 RepID=A0A444ZA16_ARAHY|nr:hypothetical protein Ahy_B05g079511 [Arachis hypogaea]
MKQEAESASYKPSSCPIYVSASHLKRFRYCAYGFISQCITLVDPLSAHNAFADITLWKCEKDTQTGLHAFLLLKQLNQVKHIKFEGSQKMEENTRLNSKQTKRQWTPHEDAKLVECLVELATTSWKCDNGTFKSGYGKYLEKMLHEKIPGCDLKVQFFYIILVFFVYNSIFVL